MAQIMPMSDFVVCKIHKNFYAKALRFFEPFLNLASAESGADIAGDLSALSAPNPLLSNFIQRML
jgi:hypothetical protein